MAKDLNVFDKEYGLLINGKWTKGSEGKLLSSYNPANGDELAKFTDATDADVDAAVTAAQEAFKTWRKTTTAERAAILNKIADVIDENAELFALQETLDNGKPIRETRAADVPLASDHFRYFASVIRGEEGTATQLDAEDLSIVLREPIGVVGQIIPWNFPFLMAAWKIAPALAAGCTIVIHPSSSTSLSLLSFAQKINHLLPKGVLNVITGRGSKSGEYMLHHKGFNKLAFTGSTEVRRRIADSFHFGIGRQIRQHLLRRYAFRQSPRRRAKRYFVQPRPSVLRRFAHLCTRRHLRQIRQRLGGRIQKNQSRPALGRRHPNGFASQCRSTRDHFEIRQNRRTRRLPHHYRR